MLTAHPSRGANDGFLVASVSTNNHVGIAVGGQLLINFGNLYDFSAADNHSEPDAKRFKGPLDLYLQGLVKSESSPQGDDNQPPADPNPSQVNFALTLLGTDAHLCYETSPDGTLLLSLNTSFTTKKNIPPHTILYTCKQIDVKSSFPDGLLWAFEKPSGVHVWEKSGAGTVRTTLEKVIKTSMASCVAKHHAFQPGAPPTLLSPQSQHPYKGRAKEPDAQALLEFAPKLSDLTVEWTVKVNEKAELVPTNIVIATKRQLKISGKNMLS